MLINWQIYNQMCHDYFIFWILWPEKKKTKYRKKTKNGFVFVFFHLEKNFLYMTMKKSLFLRFSSISYAQQLSESVAHEKKYYTFWYICDSVLDDGTTSIIKFNNTRQKFYLMDIFICPYHLFSSIFAFFSEM